MALVSEQEKRVCPVGSNATWLLIFVTVEIVSNVFVLGITIASICALGHVFEGFKPYDLQNPDAGGFFYNVDVDVPKFAEGFAKGLLIFIAVLCCLTICAAFCAILAEWKKRPGFLIPWFILIVLGVVSDIIFGVQCLVNADASGAVTRLIQITVGCFAIVITKRRYEELQRISAEGCSVDYKPLM